jgi:hypothetical protein
LPSRDAAYTGSDFCRQHRSIFFPLPLCPATQVIDLPGSFRTKKTGFLTCESAPPTEVASYHAGGTAQLEGSLSGEETQLKSKLRKENIVPRPRGQRHFSRPKQRCNARSSSKMEKRAIPTCPVFRSKTGA